MDNGTNQYYDGQMLYNADIPMYGPETMPQPNAAEPESGAAALPPEPDDSPYEDPVVRHILSLRDDEYRRRMLLYLSENVHHRPTLNPVLVMAALVLCFPVGLGMMYFGTRWGTFAKVVITVFVLLMVFAVYEILVARGVLETTSLIETVKYIISQLAI